MKVKFNTEVVCLNVNLATAIGTNSRPTPPIKDGELKYFEGADLYVLSKELFVKGLKNQVLEISSYAYNPIEHNLKFTLHHKFIQNQICTDEIDITTYEVENIFEHDFEIIEV